MMCHLGHDYYLTGVSAAASYGVSHQAAFVTQVATDGQLRSRVVAGRSRIAMLHNPETARFARSSRAVRSWTGHLCEVAVAVPEIVLFDLVARCPYRAGDSKLNIFCEFIDPGRHLPPLVDPERLAETALLYRAADRQRVGFLLQEMSDHVGRPFDLGPLAATLPAVPRTVDLERAPDRAEPPIALVVCLGFSAVECDGSGVPRKAHRRSHTRSVRQGGATPRGASMPSRTRANKPKTHH